MLGALATLLCGVGLYGVARRSFSRLLADLDPAARFGLSGLLGLALLGFATFFFGLIPGGLRWVSIFAGAAAVLGFAEVWRATKAGELAFGKPAGWTWAFVAALGLAFLFALVGVLGPSDMQDWDSLAYHLAVPKLWLEAGRMEFIPYIHHSNFPFLIDNLYIAGLAWGGEAGAKAFSLLYASFGCCALFGLARGRYGQAAGWWTALAFAAIPVTLWEAGTAYVDVGHGVWAGLAILFAAQALESPSSRRWVVLAAICAGCAAASKYTGLQVAVAAALTLLFARAASGSLVSGLKAAAIVGFAAVALCSPWLIRNYVNLANPVYPFFHSVFQGRNWDDYRSKIYQNEQQTFGVGRSESGRDWKQLPHAALGLAYQPGRFVNPGQERGMGFPAGALGAVGLAAGLVWLISGRSRTFELGALAATGVCFLFWFALSQQSRYGMIMAVPLCVLAGGAVAKLRAGPMIAVMASLQALYSLWLVEAVSVATKLPVVLGKESRERYLAKSVPFFEGAEQINLVARGGRVALFDEVFGFLLDVPYFWANPGHGTAIPYERFETGRHMAEELRRQGFSHAYVGFVFQTRDQTLRWVAASGLADGGVRPYSQKERAGLMDELQTRWKPLVAEAVASGELEPIWVSPKGVLLRIRGTGE